MRPFSRCISRGHLSMRRRVHRQRRLLSRLRDILSSSGGEGGESVGGGVGGCGLGGGGFFDKGLGSRGVDDILGNRKCRCDVDEMPRLRSRQRRSWDTNSGSLPWETTQTSKRRCCCYFFFFWFLFLFLFLFSFFKSSREMRKVTVVE